MGGSEYAGDSVLQGSVVDQNERDTRVFALAPLASILVWGGSGVVGTWCPKWHSAGPFALAIIFTLLTWVFYLPSLVILPFLLAGWRRKGANMSLRLVPFGALYGYMIARSLTPGLGFLYLGPLSGIVVGIALSIGLHDSHE